MIWNVWFLRVCPSASYMFERGVQDSTVSVQLLSVNGLAVIGARDTLLPLDRWISRDWLS